jgi:hypothetical protein
MSIEFILDNFPNPKREQEQKVMLEALESFPVKDSYDEFFDDTESDNKLLNWFKNSRN